jgi:hypothetical protein
MKMNHQRQLWNLSNLSLIRKLQKEKSNLND